MPFGLRSQLTSMQTTGKYIRFHRVSTTTVRTQVASKFRANDAVSKGIHNCAASTGESTAVYTGKRLAETTQKNGLECNYSGSLAKGGPMSGSLQQSEDRGCTRLRCLNTQHNQRRSYCHQRPRRACSWQHLHHVSNHCA